MTGRLPVKIKEVPSTSALTHIGAWLLTIIPTGLFVAAYVWALVFAVEHGKTGNLFLAILTLGVGVAAFYLMIRLRNVHGVISWRGLGSIPFWTLVTLFVICIWHAVGALMIVSTELQQWFAFGPVGLLGVFIFFACMKWLMDGAKQAKKYKV